jgi:transcription antitermination protein NusB
MEAKVAKSRRRARELALRGLYEMDITRVNPDRVIGDALYEPDERPEQKIYAEKVIRGFHEHSSQIDRMLADRIKEYDFRRIAAIDRNVLRMATYELLYEPAIPPAVTLNEAIEIAKKYSTAESGKFVNGVLGKVLADSAKANWDPDVAPKEEEPEEVVHIEELPEIEEIDVQAGSDEEKSLARIAGWKLKSEDEE